MSWGYRFRINSIDLKVEAKRIRREDKKGE